MKKIYTLMIAAVAAFGFISCSNNDVDEVMEQKKELKLNISVADLNGAETRAVKTSWAAGDKINIWYDENKGPEPDLVIKYDGSKWGKDNTATVSGQEPATSGTLKFFYEGYNDLSKYTPSFISWLGASFDGIVNLVYSETTFHPTSYTCTGDELTFNIEYWAPQTEVQVVVTDIDPAKYELKCSNLYAIGSIGVHDGFVSLGVTYLDEYVGGVANADGAAFYFSSPEDNTASATYTFTLKNTATSAEYTYSVSGKAHPAGTFQAIKINKAKFGL